MMFGPFKSIAAAAAGVAVTLCSVPASAGVVATLSATYDGFLDNTVFTLTNVTGFAEAITLITSLGPNTTVTLPTLAAGKSETYSFNRTSGGFETDPQVAGTPDATTYQFSVIENGTTLISAAFSPITNATGGYVDFLGNTCDGFGAGCTNANGSAVVLSGLVASVPEPFALSIMLSGLFGLVAVRRRG